MFDTSQCELIRTRPWRWTTLPAADGTGGVKSTPLNGVFIRLSDALIDRLTDELDATEKAELRQWIHILDESDADPLKRPSTWNVPVWCGDSRAIFLRVPNAIWSNPDTAPPAKVKRYFRNLFKEDG